MVFEKEINTLNICYISLSIVGTFDLVFELKVNSLGIIRDYDVPKDILLMYLNTSKSTIYMCISSYNIKRYMISYETVGVGLCMHVFLNSP